MTFVEVLFLLVFLALSARSLIHARRVHHNDPDTAYAFKLGSLAQAWGMFLMAIIVVARDRVGLGGALLILLGAVIYLVLLKRSSTLQDRAEAKRRQF